MKTRISRRQTQVSKYLQGFLRLLLNMVDVYLIEIASRSKKYFSEELWIKLQQPLFFF